MDIITYEFILRMKTNTILPVLMSLFNIMPVVTGCANEVNPCGGHGDCVENTCLCHAYYAGYECQECVLCPGRFQHVWSCVECMVSYHYKLKNLDRTFFEIPLCYLLSSGVSTTSHKDLTSIRPLRPIIFR